MNFFYYNPFSESIKNLIFNNNTFRLLIPEKVDSIEINSMYQNPSFYRIQCILSVLSIEPLNQESRKEYFQSVGGEKVSLMVLGDNHLIKLRDAPALSFVPLPLAPPKGCWPTTAPVGLSFI